MRLSAAMFNPTMAIPCAARQGAYPSTAAAAATRNKRQFK